MSLKGVFAPYFKIGAAVPAQDMGRAAAREALRREYDSITCENEMKPECLLDATENKEHPEKHALAPAVHFDKVRGYLDFAVQNGIAMRGHTLVWHNQTPRWFFTEGYQDGEDAPLAGRETMLARLESYIRSVLTYFQTEYPGLIYAWDVVNEAVEDGGLRHSLWTETVGEDFILQAFRFARKYAAPEVSLFYNDYDTFLPWKREVIIERVLRPLLAEGLVDGVGMQSHLTMDKPSMAEYEKTVRAFGALGIQVQVTELDIHNTDPSGKSMEALAERYREVFYILTRAKKDGGANVTSVTFWGCRMRKAGLPVSEGRRVIRCFSSMDTGPNWLIGPSWVCPDWRKETARTVFRGEKGLLSGKRSVPIQKNIM